jgi:sugar phosphate isomerase/epimerase
MMDIYLSTLAFNNDIFETDKNCRKFNIGIEYSSGISYNNNNIIHFEKTSYQKLSHNYFPPPEDEFVLNLASKNEIIRKRSIDHCIHNLQICSKNNTKFYAAHAGFCLDPSYDQLGKEIVVKSNFNREQYFKLFLISIKEILDKAEELQVPFLIENNVLSDINYKANNYVNPFLCCDSDDIIRLFESVKSNFFGLLLDTGHLKVSSKSLSLDLFKEYDKIKKYIRAVHHSDNDGLKDSNQIITKNYWFLDYIDEFQNLSHVIETKNMSESSIEKTLNLLIRHDKNSNI